MPMNRRRFFESSTSARAAAPASPASAAPPAPGRMRLGCQSAPTTDEHLKYLARYGVDGVTGYPHINGDRVYATVEELEEIRDLAVKNKVPLEGIAAP